LSGRPGSFVLGRAFASVAVLAVVGTARAEDDLVAVRAELARQSAALEVLQRAQAEREKTEQARERALRFSGYLQVDWRVFDQSSVDEVNASTRAPLNQDRFVLRRARLRADAERGLFSGAFELDANTVNGAQVRPVDAEISVRAPEREGSTWPTAKLSVGLFKIPFGVEVPERELARPFLERSTVSRALFPGEDLGVRLGVRYRFADLTLAVMNGHPSGDRTFPLLDPDGAKELVGRLGVTAKLTRAVAIRVGASGDHGKGFHEGTPTTKDQLVWRDDNGDGIVQATEIQVTPGSSATPSDQFGRFAVGADARVSVSFAPGFELVLSAEVMRAENLDRGLEPADPTGAGYDLRELGYYLGLTQELTAWGLVGIRYDRYDPDQDAHELEPTAVVPRDRSYQTLALLGFVRYERARLAVEYDHNDNALGRDVNGKPTTLASDSLTVRAQLEF